MSGLARRRQVQQEQTQSTTPALPDLADERVQEGFNVDAVH